MFSSRVLGFLFITLCCVFFVCAHANASKEQATQSVKDAKASTSDALGKAQNELNEAEYVNRTVEARRAKIEKAVTDSEAAANGNAEADSSVAKAKSALGEFCKSYPDAKEKAENVLINLKGLLLKACGLDNKVKGEIAPSLDSSNDYTKVDTDASDVKSQAETVKKDIESAKRQLSTAKAALWTLSNYAEKAQMAKYEVDAIVSVAKIETLIKNADIDMHSIAQKRDEIHATVEEIKKLLKDTPKDLIYRINTLLTTAEGDSRRITSKIQEVHEFKKTMLLQKQYTAETVVIIKEQTDESKARAESRHIDSYTKKAADTLQKIKEALKVSQTYVINANRQRDTAIKELSPKNSERDEKIDQVTEKPKELVNERATIPTNKEAKQKINIKPSQAVQDTTGILQKDTTVKQTMVNSEKTIIGTSENSMHQTANRQTGENRE